MKTFNDPEAFARVKRLPPYVFTVTDRLRDEAIARGVDVVDFSMGNPDGATPDRIVERLRSAVGDSKLHRYLNPRGLPELRASVSRWWKRRHGVEVDPEREVLVTIGSKEGIGHALIAMLSEGDTVLAPAPTYPIHAFGAVLAGAESLPVAVGPGVDFFESLVAAAERAEKRPKGLVVNFPANPTAAVATQELFEKIVRFAEARDMFIVSDLAYCDIVFDGPKAPSMLAVPGARDRTLEFMSLSKSYNMPGWRVGFCAGNPALVAAAARVKSYLDYGLFGAVQAAAMTALDECDDEVVKIREKYRVRRDALVRHFGAAGWQVPAPAASMFAWAPIPEPFRPLGSLEFCKRLIDEAGVAVAPGIGFGPAGEGSVRIALIVDEPRVQLAAERIEKFLKKGPGGR
ncbi:aminotransferase class I/II-fold pyridoxal phosphate-dependent enzyme [Anaeromyxobacter sp. PSR-1]|uniref:aminotransferase class I/II-fold pyridoxal phosphate-dependent enzyme n=1 Tax=unclassified Anaeromyxobacter TaxID=2620896 RepID=UPI0005DF6608|nr:aminotransferase class I/II-fold pyridoxal phosphate-dependent enzyme [Anaeromyxobacter sp. PSR-1]GAO02769.1 glutamate-pyruvate aminotransferase AlaC [Anaeromyxobacter sp. PSR-1]